MVKCLQVNTRQCYSRKSWFISVFGFEGTIPSKNNSIFLDSSMVEHSAVNRGVVGSSPTRGVVLIFASQNIRTVKNCPQEVLNNCWKQLNLSHLHKARKNQKVIGIERNRCWSHNLKERLFDCCDFVKQNHNGSMVKRLRHRPFTAVTRVQFPLESF